MRWTILLPNSYYRPSRGDDTKMRRRAWSHGQRTVGSLLLLIGVMTASGLLSVTISSGAANAAATPIVDCGTSLYGSPPTTPISTCIEMQADANPIQQGQSVTFTAYVCNVNGPYHTSATGSFTFNDGSTSLGVVPVSPTPGAEQACTDLNEEEVGIATLTTSSLAYGTHQITARYTGDAKYAGSTSTPLTENVGSPSSSSALTSSPNPSDTSCRNASEMQPIVLTFAVPPAPGIPEPTGLVTFTSGNLDQPRSLDQNGAVSITITPDFFTFNNGSFSQTFKASYSGDSNYPPFSASVTQIFHDATTVSVSSSANPSAPGQNVVLTANVSGDCGAGSFGGPPEPTGSVTFSEGGSILGTVGLGNSTTATFAISSLPAGDNVITSAYSGDGIYLPSSISGTQTVVPPVTNGTLAAPVVGIAALPDGNGYWLTDAQGGVSPHGTAVNYGSMAGQPLNAAISHIVSTPDGKGYWLVASDGGTFAFGDAGYFGSMGGRPLNAPVVDIAPTADGLGYWLVGSDGGIFAFGDAGFHGSMGGQHLNRPIVGITADYATGGYWEVATDGGIFAFGAPFFGSTGNISLAKPVNGMTATSDGQGYWFVASDGGIFAFGDAQFYGSAVGQSPNAAIVGMATDNATGGYWLVTSNGSVFDGNAPNYGVD
jgi:hypothetical protein